MAKAIEEKDFAKAMSLRDPEFRESLDGFFAQSTLDSEKKLPASHVRILDPLRAVCVDLLLTPYRECELRSCSK